jgi:nucleoside phosphorylase
MAARTLAAARLARLLADGLADGVVTGLAGAGGDGLAAGDFARADRADSRDIDADGFGVLSPEAPGVTEVPPQDADPAAAHAGVRESAAAVTLAAGSKWCPRT